MSRPRDEALGFADLTFFLNVSYGKTRDKGGEGGEIRVFEIRLGAWASRNNRRSLLNLD